MSSEEAAASKNTATAAADVEQKAKEKHTSDFQNNQNKKNAYDSRNNKESLGLGVKSWRSLMEVSMARSRKIKGSNFVQLATVDPETNEPRCRTVVFRGFQKVPDDHASLAVHNCEELSTVMKMCTDRRSRKVSEASQARNQQEVGEIVWWFAKSNEQYRLRGKILFVGGGDFPQDDDAFLMQARKELWGNLSDSARESFMGPNVPGLPVDTTSAGSASEDATAIPAGGRDAETGKPVPPPDNFLLMLLFPHNVDYLNLKENYRQIDEQSQADEKKAWSFQEVNA